MICSCLSFLVIEQNKSLVRFSYQYSSTATSGVDGNTKVEPTTKPAAVVVKELLLLLAQAKGARRKQPPQPPPPETNKAVE
jgi:hypothetical protein